jgi:putative ABC transport system permease protein
MSSTGLVLLIGCANLANLALARGVSREREVVVRASLGAGRWRLIRQFLTENVVLVACAEVVLGIGVGYATMKGIQMMLPEFALAREISVEMDMRVLRFAIAVSVFTGLLFGMAPALQATRPDLASSMKEESRGSSGGAGRKRLRDLADRRGSRARVRAARWVGLMMRSFFRLMTVDTGLRCDEHPDAPSADHHRAVSRSDAVESISERDPHRRGRRAGVRETAYSCAPPLQGSCYGCRCSRPTSRWWISPTGQAGFFKVVSPSYFSTLGIKMQKGRALSDRDTWNAPRALVMNERLAKRYFDKEESNRSAPPHSGNHRRQDRARPDVSWEVVGVIGDEKIGGPPTIAAPVSTSRTSRVRSTAWC